MIDWLFGYTNKKLSESAIFFQCPDHKFIVKYRNSYVLTDRETTKN